MVALADDEIPRTTLARFVRATYVRGLIVGHRLAAGADDDDGDAPDPLRVGVKMAAVPPRPWSQDPVELLQRLSPSAQDGRALTLWAVWCVEALDYLDEIDDEFFGRSRTRGLRPNVIDLAHVR